jgi:ComF family protein
LFYPAHCVECGNSVKSDAYLCADCAKTAAQIKAPYCEKCSMPFHGAISGPFTCANCEGLHHHFAFAVSCFRFRGVVRRMIHRFKYNEALYLRHPLGDWLAGGLRDERIAGETFDCLVPVPLHPARKREREFNQAEVLADLLAGHACKPVLNCLQRVRYTAAQTRLDRLERMENLRNAFRLRHNFSVQNQRILLVDDVFTTGSTLNECARVLRRAGAASVRAITVARG